MKHKIFLMLIIICIIYLKYVRKRNVTYERSDIDGKEYIVRNKLNKRYASNMLAKLRENIEKVVKYVHQNSNKYPKYKTYIDTLNDRIKNVIISESDEDAIYTSYCVNKGAELIFCLRSKINDKFHNLNMITYVAMHEISHIACPEYNHTPLFNEIFAFMVNIAIKIGVYKYINFSQNPLEYCGITIDQSII